MIETRMNERVAYGFRRIKRTKTLIVPLENGSEVRNINWTKSKREWTAMYQSFTPAQFVELDEMFEATHGAGHSFRFKDWFDYSATDEPIGNTPGTNTTPVQLIKAYTFGSETVTRTITKPVSGTVTVYQYDGVSAYVAKAGTVSTTTGLFTPTTNWTAGRALRATFEFDVVVRFTNDELDSAYDNYGAITTNAALIELF